MWISLKLFLTLSLACIDLHCLCVIFLICFSSKSLLGFSCPLNHLKIICTILVFSIRQVFWFFCKEMLTFFFFLSFADIFEIISPAQFVKSFGQCPMDVWICCEYLDRSYTSIYLIQHHLPPALFVCIGLKDKTLSITQAVIRLLFSFFFTSYNLHLHIHVVFCLSFPFCSFD